MSPSYCSLKNNIPSFGVGGDDADGELVLAKSPICVDRETVKVKKLIIVLSSSMREIQDTLAMVEE